MTDGISPAASARPAPADRPKTEVVLITGCSSGFGLLSAVAFARLGYRVFATMRDLSKRTALDEAAADAGVHLEVIALDVADPAEM